MINLKISEIIIESLKYPLDDEENFKYVAHFGGLLLVAIIIFALFVGLGSLFGKDIIGAFFAVGIAVAAITSAIVFLILPGYGLSVMKEGIKRSGTIPEFDIGTNIIDTIKLVILSFIYNIIPGIIIFILFVLVGVIGATTKSVATLFPLIIVIIIAIILTIAFEFLLLVATLRLAQYGSFSEALSFSNVIADLKQIGILKTAVVWVAVVFINSLISGVMIALIYTGIGIIAIPIIVLPFSVLFNAYAAGLLYSDVA